jgi:inosose dehydratase
LGGSFVISCIGVIEDAASPHDKMEVWGGRTTSRINVMNKHNPKDLPVHTSRRQFLQLGGAAALACAASTASAEDDRTTGAKKPTGKSLKLGVASYTFRNFDLDKTLAMTKRAGLKYISLKSMHLPLQAKPKELAAIAAKVAEAGLTLYGGGVINMAKESEVTQAFDYGKAAGLRLLIVSPAPALLSTIDKHVKEYDISVAIHNHGPGDRRFPTPQSVYEKVNGLDHRVGLCIDIGHTLRAGADVVEAINKYHDRLFDMHFKDVTAAAANGNCVAFGRGVIDVPAMLRALIGVGYEGMASYEYEAEETDPLPGLCECVGYTKGVLATL